MSRKDGALSERLSALFDIPAEAMGNVPRVTLTGRGLVQIEGCEGLVELTPERVGVRCGAYVVRITGANLALKGMNGGRIAFSGSVAGLDFGG